MSAPAAIWAQSLRGRAIDLLSPRQEDVDFAEIAGQLARLARYAGASRVPVSVALHTLIACDAAPPALRPWVLLHDAHETRIGDITAPARDALRTLVERSGGRLLAALLDEAFDDLAWGHDCVIHAAAKLPLPDAAQRKAIRVADLVALRTERRDFLSPSPRPWAPEIEALTPLATDYGGLGAMSPDNIAERLLVLFHTYLPVFAGGAAPAA